MLWLCLYPITYSLRFIISGNNSLEINISLMLMSFILKTFFMIAVKVFFFSSSFHQNLCFFSPFYTMPRQKNYIFEKRNYFNNLGIYAMVLCFVAYFNA